MVYDIWFIYVSSEKEITAAETSSEEREGGNFTFQSRNADLNTSGPGAKV